MYIYTLCVSVQWIGQRSAAEQSQHYFILDCKDERGTRVHLYFLPGVQMLDTSPSTSGSTLGVSTARTAPTVPSRRPEGAACPSRSNSINLGFPVGICSTTGACCELICR